MNDLIKQVAEEAAKETVIQLKKQGMLKDNRKTPFQKVEALLYNYNNFRKVLQEKEEEIKLLEREPIEAKSNSISGFLTQQRYDNRNEAEKKEDEILKIRDSVRVTRNLIATLEKALDKIKENPYYDIIQMKYFEGKSNEEMAAVFEKNEKTITRNKNKLIETLQVYLFSDECIEEIFA